MAARFVDKFTGPQDVDPHFRAGALNVSPDVVLTVPAVFVAESPRLFVLNLKRMHCDALRAVYVRTPFVSAALHGGAGVVLDELSRDACLVLARSRGLVPDVETSGEPVPLMFHELSTPGSALLLTPAPGSEAHIAIVSDVPPDVLVEECYFVRPPLPADGFVSYGVRSHAEETCRVSGGATVQAVSIGSDLLAHPVAGFVVLDPPEGLLRACLVLDGVAFVDMTVDEMRGIAWTMSGLRPGGALLLPFRANLGRVDLAELVLTFVSPARPSSFSLLLISSNVRRVSQKWGLVNAWLS